MYQMMNFSFLATPFKYCNYFSRWNKTNIIIRINTILLFFQAFFQFLQPYRMCEISGSNQVQTFQSSSFCKFFYIKILARSSSKSTMYVEVRNYSHLFSLDSYGKTQDTT